MAAVQFHVNEVFDIPTRDGLLVVGSTRNGEFVGIPRLRDEVSGQPVHVLGADHPTPRTQRTGETILLLDRADAEYVRVGRSTRSPDGPTCEAIEPTAVRLTRRVSGTTRPICALPQFWMWGGGAAMRRRYPADEGAERLLADDGKRRGALRDRRGDVVDVWAVVQCCHRVRITALDDG